MKIVLTAFQGKLKSEPMDWPEETGDRVRLFLDTDANAIGIFQWGGDYVLLTGIESGKVARVYRLVEVNS